MARYPQIQTEVCREENTIVIGFQPSLEDHIVYDLEDYMGRLNGVVAVSPRIGSIALRVANPLFSLTDTAQRAKDTALFYFNQGDLPKHPVMSFEARRYKEREFHPVDLCPMMNYQLLEDEHTELQLLLSHNQQTTNIAHMIYGIGLADKGYNLHIRIKPLFAGHGIKDEVADSTISFLEENQGTIFRSPLLPPEQTYSDVPVDFDSALDVSAWTTKIQ